MLNQLVRGHAVQRRNLVEVLAMTAAVAHRDRPASQKRDDRVRAETVENALQPPAQLRAAQPARIEQDEERPVGGDGFLDAGDRSRQQLRIERQDAPVDRFVDRRAELDHQAAIAGIQEAWPDCRWRHRRFSAFPHRSVSEAFDTTPAGHRNA